MEPCSRCGQLMFAICRIEGHGSWCPRPSCDGSLTCPRCEPVPGAISLHGFVNAALGAVVLWGFSILLLLM